MGVCCWYTSLPVGKHISNFVSAEPDTLHKADYTDEYWYTNYKLENIVCQIISQEMA